MIRTKHECSFCEGDGRVRTDDLDEAECEPCHGSGVEPCDHCDKRDGEFLIQIPGTAFFIVCDECVVHYESEAAA